MEIKQAKAILLFYGKGLSSDGFLTAEYGGRIYSKGCPFELKKGKDGEISIVHGKSVLFKGTSPNEFMDAIESILFSPEKIKLPLKQFFKYVLEGKILYFTHDEAGGDWHSLYYYRYMTKTRNESKEIFYEEYESLFLTVQAAADILERGYTPVIEENY